jgi:hypothetical protein
MEYTRRLVIAWNAESPRFRFSLTTEGLTIAHRFLLFFLLHQRQCDDIKRAFTREKVPDPLGTIAIRMAYPGRYE